MLIDGQNIENTLYFEGAGAVGTETMILLGDALIVWWATELAPNLTKSLQLREIYLTLLTTAVSPTVTRVPSTTTFGALDVPPVPNNASLCVSFRTAGRGRSARGRNYVPGIAEGEVNISRITQARCDAIAQAYSNIPAVLVEQDVEAFTWVVVSRYTSGLPRGEGVTEPIQVATVVDNVIDSQRRRLPGRGQ